MNTPDHYRSLRLRYDQRHTPWAGAKTPRDQNALPSRLRPRHGSSILTVQSRLTASLVGPLGDALIACQRGLWGVLSLSLVLNVLTLSGSFFMLLVYDVVLPGRSVPTLVGLILIVAVLYVFQGLIDYLRQRILGQIGAAVDAEVSGKVFDTLGRSALNSARSGDGLQPVRDIDQIRSFLAGPGPGALADLPWILVFLGICFLFHPAIGLTAAVGALVLIGLTWLTENRVRRPSEEASLHASHRNALASASLGNAEAIVALGMQSRIRMQWSQVSAKTLASQQVLAGWVGGMGSLTRVLRMAIQSIVLAVGALLVMRGEASGGVIFASSILTARALAPVEVAIANWRGFIAARLSWDRLSAQLREGEIPSAALKLPAPSRSLTVESIFVAPPGGRAMTLQDVSLSLQAGSGMAVIGPSGSGKSTLVRAVVNVWRPVRGYVRLDGAALDQWHADDLGGHIGYLPQNVELMAGTVAQNIARFDPVATPESVLAAAAKADVNGMIVRLPLGYDTQIGEGGSLLSAGQRQRVALARALYGDPFLVVLDEPNSNLDAEGEQALIGAMRSVRERGGIILVVAHRPTLLDPVDQVLVLRDGRTHLIGARDDVLAKISPRSGPTPVPLRNGR